MLHDGQKWNNFQSIVEYKWEEWGMTLNSKLSGPEENEAALH